MSLRPAPLALIALAEDARPIPLIILPPLAGSATAHDG
jgi:hypothetical protein